MTTLAAGLATIVNELWSDVLKLPVTRDDGSSIDADEQMQPTMTCVVIIEGAWNGAVALTCSSILAERIAMAMLGVPATESLSVRDALGEITNIVAGNAKALLPHPSTMSLPIVAEGSDRPDSLNDAPIVALLEFRSAGERFIVTALGSAADMEPV